MSYNPENQYRCTIIRGKSQSEMEDWLPFYAQTVHKFCPCTKNEFDMRCNKEFSKFLFKNEDYDGLTDANKKTIRNHITEIMGKLFGLYYRTSDDIVNESPSCAFLLEKNDFPAFFKNICLNLQFPNFADSFKTLQERVSKKINIRPLCYIVKFLDYARKQQNNLAMSKQEIGYYILNNLEVLQGTVSVDEVYSRILSDRKSKIHRAKLTGSHDWQHIKEQFNLLELSNIVESDADYIWLNGDEENAILTFIKKCEQPIFDVYTYNLHSKSDKKQLEFAWDFYYGKLNPEILKMETPFNKIVIESDVKREKTAVGYSTNELGDKGEAFVYRMECNRVRAYKERLVNKVLLLGKTKGLGYDISSIEANENPQKPEFARYIEVKTTTRMSEPKFDENWKDFVSLSAKEWIAAEQHREFYNIYRVYFTKTKVIVMKINNPFQKNINNEIDVYATNYKMDFTAKVLTKQYEERI